MVNIGTLLVVILIVFCSIYLALTWLFRAYPIIVCSAKVRVPCKPYWNVELLQALVTLHSGCRELHRATSDG